MPDPGLPFVYWRWQAPLLVAVFRAAFRPYFAGLLLLCLGRTLLPEAWVLAWHPHQHTTSEVAWAPRRAGKPPRLLLVPRHQHCHAEQFYDAPFMVAAAVLVPPPQLRSCFPQLAAAAGRTCQQPPGHRAAPRGPPAGFAATACSVA